MNELLSIAARCFYERTLENYETRMNTINTKEKRKKYEREISGLKVLIQITKNILDDGIEK